MSRERTITQESFDILLTWLDNDRDKAGQKYETIRNRLIKIFTCRGCNEAEDLADETINRVTIKAKEMVHNYVGEPALFFYGVAQKVYLESLRKKSSQTELPYNLALTEEEPDDMQEYLKRCLAKLEPDQRELVIEYYQSSKQSKIDHRKELAEQFGIAVNALRIRAHRIRNMLQKCVQKYIAT